MDALSLFHMVLTKPLHACRVLLLPRTVSPSKSPDQIQKEGNTQGLSPLRSLYGYLSLVQFSRIVVSSSLRPHRHLPHQMVCGLFSNLIEDSMCLLTMYGQPYLETANLDTFP